MSKVLYKAFEVDNVSKIEFVEIARPTFSSLEIKTKENEVHTIGMKLEKLKEELEFLRKEKVKLEGQFEEKQRLLEEEMRLEHARLLQEASEKAEQIVQSATIQAEETQKEAVLMKENIEKEAINSLKNLVKEKEQKLNEQLSEESEKGRQEGYEVGYKQGASDLDKVIGKLQSIISVVINKRKEIIETSSEQIMTLIMQVVIKVVKKITETQKGIVIGNVNEALKKVRDKTKITIRVNLDDIDIVNQKKDELISKFDNIDSLEVLEDISVSKGGCVVETDFGEIDARISSQLEKIEERVKNFSPLS